MKKIWYIPACILELASLAGAYMIHYFAKRKLGMVRYLNFKNMNWEKAYPVDLIQKISVVIVCAAVLLLLYALFKKRKQAAKPAAAMSLVMIVLTVLYIVYTLAFSTQVMADYYFLCILFGLAAVLQIISTAVSVLTLKMREEK